MENLTFIQLYRKLLGSAVFQNEGLLKVWIWCLLKAGYKEKTVPITTGRGITEVDLKIGEFIFGRNKNAKDLNMNPQTLYKRILKLKKLNQITIQSYSHYSIIKIVNWELYQNEIPKQLQAKEHPKLQPSNNQVTTKLQPSNTNNKDNKDKKGEKRKENILTQKSEDLFDKFWEVYPKKKDKQKAQIIWLKIKPDEKLTQTMLDNLTIAVKSQDWLKNNGQYIPLPTTWLNNARWEDEYEQPKSSNRKQDVGDPEDYRQAAEEYKREIEKAKEDFKNDK